MSHHRRGTYSAELAYAALMRNRRPRSSRIVPIVGLLALLGGAAWVVNRFAPDNKEHDSSDGMTRVKRVLATQAQTQQVYDFFKHPERLPEVMPMLEGVTANGRQSTWVVKLGGETKSLSMHLHDDQPGQRLTWRTGDDAPAQLSLTLSLEPMPFDRGTAMQLVLEFDAPAKPLFGKVAKLALQDVLLKTRALLETGEVPTTKGQPSGRGEARASAGGAV
jgi:uncharacterized membrane protein